MKEDYKLRRGDCNPLGGQDKYDQRNRVFDYEGNVKEGIEGRVWRRHVALGITHMGATMLLTILPVMVVAYSIVKLTEPLEEGIKYLIRSF